METSVYIRDEGREDEDDDEVELKARFGDVNSETWRKIKSRANALRHLVARDPLAADVKLTLFASAVFSYRYLTVARPLPREYDCPGGINRLTEALDAAPALRSLLGGGPAAELAPFNTLGLLLWLLTPPSAPDSPGAVLRALPRPPAPRDCQPPNYLFEVDNPSLDEAWRSLARGKKTIIAFLGQPLDAFHSIVHRGVLHLGAAIRLKRNLGKALEMSAPGYGLGSSELGARLQCVAEVEVIVDKGMGASADSDDFFLHSGKLARVSRLYLFRAKATIAVGAGAATAETFSYDKRLASAATSPALSRAPAYYGDSTSVKLPEFRFEVETSPARGKRSRTSRPRDSGGWRNDSDQSQQISSLRYELKDDRLKRMYGCEEPCFCNRRGMPKAHSFPTGKSLNLPSELEEELKEMTSHEYLVTDEDLETMDRDARESRNSFLDDSFHEHHIKSTSPDHPSTEVLLAPDRSRYSDTDTSGQLSQTSPTERPQTPYSATPSTQRSTPSPETSLKRMSAPTSPASSPYPSPEPPPISPSSPYPPPQTLTSQSQTPQAMTSPYPSPYTTTPSPSSQYSSLQTPGSPYSSPQTPQSTYSSPSDSPYSYSSSPEPQYPGMANLDVPQDPWQKPKILHSTMRPEATGRFHHTKDLSVSTISKGSSFVSTTTTDSRAGETTQGTRSNLYSQIQPLSPLQIKPPKTKYDHTDDAITPWNATEARSRYESSADTEAPSPQQESEKAENAPHDETTAPSKAETPTSKKKKLKKPCAPKSKRESSDDESDDPGRESKPKRKALGGRFKTSDKSRRDKSPTSEKHKQEPSAESQESSSKGQVPESGMKDQKDENAKATDEIRIQEETSSTFDVEQRKAEQEQQAAEKEEASKIAPTPKRKNQYKKMRPMRIEFPSKKTPKESTTESPKKFPKKSPKESPKESSKESSKKSPKESPKKSPMKFPKKSPKKSPEEPQMGPSTAESSSHTSLGSPETKKKDGESSNLHDRLSSPHSSWAETDTDDEIWDELKKTEFGGQQSADDPEESIRSIRSVISAESEELRREFEETLIEPIFHSQTQRDGRGRRLLILFLHSSHPDGT